MISKYCRYTEAEEKWNDLKYSLQHNKNAV